MKLLFYIHAITGGGAERVLSVIVNNLALRQYDVLLATDTNQPFSYEIVNKVRVMNLYRGINDRKRFSRFLLLRKNIRKIATQERPDIIIAFGSSMGASVLFCTLGLRIPVVVSEHTNVSRNLGRTLNIKRQLFYPMAHCITVLTRTDYKKWINKRWKTVYMPNPVSYMNRITSETDRKKIVLAVGRVNQWRIKGFDTLLLAWSKICHQNRQWTLQIAGDVDDNSMRVLQRIIHINDCINVRFLGFRKDVFEIMSKSMVFCLSSRVEGLPMALIEAMHAGCCCVSFDVETGPSEIIQNHKSGILVKNQDVSELAKQLETVMVDDELRNRYSTQAPFSVEKYSTEKIVSRWEELFKKILNK